MMQEGHNCNLKNVILSLFFLLLFFIQDFSLNTALTVFKLVVDNIRVEGTVPQFFYHIGPSFILM